MRRRLTVGAAAALLLGGAALALLTMPPPLDDGMPAFAHRTGEIHDAYTFANSSGGAAALQWMACYCGCGGHTGHSDNLACFVKSDGSGFEEHGSQCGVCVDVALTAKQGLEQGMSLREIRDSLDAKYAGYPATDTPVPA